MVCSEQPLTKFTCSMVGGRLCVEVPWWSANVLRRRLAVKGLRTTACFDPLTHTAFLEMDGNVDPESVLALLEEAKDRPRLAEPLPSSVLRRRRGAGRMPRAYAVC